MAYESPTYVVTRTLGPVEVRQYEPYLAAEVIVDGSIESAGSKGFRALASFIFGGNSRDDSAGGEKIAMTTPVTQEPVGERYRVRFMMPSRYTAESLPDPNDPRVEICSVDPGCVAALRYSGRWTAKSYEIHLANLRSALNEAGLVSFGQPVWARYDPPWTPWFMRRNEVLLQISDNGGPGQS